MLQEIKWTQMGLEPITFPVQEGCTACCASGPIRAETRIRTGIVAVEVQNSTLELFPLKLKERYRAENWNCTNGSPLQEEGSAY